MYYEGFNTGDRIEITPTYRCQIDPMLSSSIRDYNNPGASYKPSAPIYGIVISENLNGIWVTAEIPIYENFEKTDRFNLVREYYEKDKYIFKNLKNKKYTDMLKSI
jgi:hypothetical protein